MYTIPRYYSPEEKADWKQWLKDTPMGLREVLDRDLPVAELPCPQSAQTAASPDPRCGKVTPPPNTPPTNQEKTSFSQVQNISKNCRFTPEKCLRGRDPFICHSGQADRKEARADRTKLWRAGDKVD